MFRHARTAVRFFAKKKKKQRPSDYRAVVGLEVHAQLLTKRKAFCKCLNCSDGAPNAHTCGVCLGEPGSLPVANPEMVALGAVAAVALRCESVADVVTWDRKSYFYPDLPKGFQITQKRSPLAVGGSVEILGDADARGGGGVVAIGVESAHLEEDSAKLSYKKDGDAFDVDFNRSGCALVEIVSKPELRSGEEAARYARELQRTLQRVGASDGDMAAGSFRVDVNVSVAKDGDVALREKVEIKNLNSFKAVRGAVDHEVERQGRAYDAGDAVLPETRSWDGKKTAVLRVKGGAEAYRFAPEPDLPPRPFSEFDRPDAASVLAATPPAARAALEALGASPAQARALVDADADGAAAAFFEAAVALGAPADAAATWLSGEVAGAADKLGLATYGHLAPRDLADLLVLMGDGSLGRRAAKDLLPALLGAPHGSVRAEVADRDLGQIADAAALDAFVADVLAAHPDELAKFAAGAGQLRKLFLGKAMAASRGRADPAGLNAALDRALPR